MTLTANLSVADAAEQSVHDIGGQNVSFKASAPEVLGALKRILRKNPLTSSPSSGTTSVTAILGRDGWQIEVDGAIVRGLALKSPAPLVAEEMVAAACSSVSSKTSSILLRGLVFEKDDVTIAIIGDDIDSAKVLGLHLHSRGWSAITFGYGFIGQSSLDVTGLNALASINSTSIDQIPPRYRPAVEASLWYDSGFDLTFYTVDPLLVEPRSGSKAVLTHLVIVDGVVDDVASLSSEFESSDLGPFANHPLIDSLCVARLTQGTPIASCGAVERWVAGL